MLRLLINNIRKDINIRKYINILYIQNTPSLLTIDKHYHNYLWINRACKYPLVKPPLGRPPLGRPPLGRPHLGRPPLGRPPLGRPPLGRPHLGRPPLGKGGGSFSLPGRTPIRTYTSRIKKYLYNLPPLLPPLLPDTNKFIIYNFITTMLSSIHTTISYDCLLHACWEPEYSSTISSQLLLKEILGQFVLIGTITKIIPNIDNKTATYGKIAVTMDSVSIITECYLTILNPGYTQFITLTSITNTIKCISLSVHSAINSKIINKVSVTSDKVGESYMKLLILNTAANTMGMLIGVIINCIVSNSEYRMVIVSILTVPRIWLYHKLLQAAGVTD